MHVTVWCELCGCDIPADTVLGHIKIAHPEHLPHIEGWLRERKKP
jgi:hypothetical protein